MKNQIMSRMLYSRKFGSARSVVQVVTLAIIFTLIFAVYQEVNDMTDWDVSAIITRQANSELLSRKRRDTDEAQKKLSIPGKTIKETTTTETPTTTTKKKSLVEQSSMKGYARVKDECGGYYQAGRMQRTVHMHVLGRDDLYRFNDVTMVVHMTSERTDKLYRLALRWSGPIAVSVYLNRTIDLKNFTKEMGVLLAPRKNIAMHILEEAGDFYPVNFLRNIALDSAATKYIFLTDIDFEPMQGLDIRLQDYIDKGYIKPRTALIVPVFEFVTQNVSDFPSNRKELLKIWKKDKIVKPFHFNTTNGGERPTTGHKQTDYVWWAKTKKPYYINWAEYYEPYVVLEKASSPKYWPYYVGRFFNKAAHIAEMFITGFEFVVLPDVFAIHTPHIPKPGSDIEMSCGKRVNVRFKIYLMDTYGWKMPVKIS